jgi:hypothetical protein
MSLKNIRSPITIAPKNIIYDKSIKVKWVLFLSPIAIPLFALLCCPILMLIQITNARVEEPATTYFQQDNTIVPESNFIAPSRTPSSSQPTSTLSVFSTSIPKENQVAEISCANKLYNVNLRRTPGYNNKDDSDSIYEVPCGEHVELLGDTKYVDSLTWWKVSWNGYTGWMADHTASGKTVLIFSP